MNQQTSRVTDKNDQRLSKRARPKKKKVSQTYWAEEQDESTTSVEAQKRSKLLRQFGDFSLAYSTAFQPRLKYFVDSGPGAVPGFVAYRQRWGTTFVLGDPVVAAESRVELIRRFHSKVRKPTYCQVSESTARELEAMNYFVNEMGVDTILDLDRYDFSGKEKEWLRYAANWTAKRGFEVRECTIDEVGADGVETISEAWRNTRTVKRKEVRFLNRPIVLKDEIDVRKFYLFDSARRPLAFVFFDPMYRDGELIGYVTAFKRRHPDAPQYAEHAIMKYAIEKMKAEGVPQINLGLSPGASIEDTQFKHNRLTSRLFRFGFDSKIINRYFYHLQGHANYKRRFRGREVKTYFASPVRFDLFRQAALVGLCGIA